MKDPIAIENKKAGAVRALANYMLYESGNKDDHMKDAMERFNSRYMPEGK